MLLKKRKPWAYPITKPINGGSYYDQNNLQTQEKLLWNIIFWSEGIDFNIAKLNNVMQCLFGFLAVYEYNYACSEGCVNQETNKGDGTRKPRSKPDYVWATHVGSVISVW